MGLVVIDVFFCTGSEGRLDAPDWLLDIRASMADLCETRWSFEEGVNLRILTPSICKHYGYTAPFQLSRRQYAENETRSDIYVVSDDDCLLTSDPTVGPVVEIMDRNPNVGILALKMHNKEPMVRATVPAKELYETDDLIESHAVGGIRFCRKGIIKEWPAPSEENPYQYDSIHGPAVQAAGYVSAYTKAYSMMHIGSTYSLTWIGETWRFWEGTK
jgi:hypothetical protein